MIIKLLLIILFTLLLIPAQAYAFDYFPNNIFTLKEKSLVCVLNPPPELKFHILKAVNSWDYYMNTSWYTVKVITVELLECDAIVLFDNPRNVFDDTKNDFGVTRCWENAKLTQFGQTIEKDRYCRSAINLDITGHMWYQTVVHEMGHVLGLGHLLPIEAKDFPFVFMKHDMMFPFVDDQVTISNESIDALWHFRTYPQLAANYTLSHNTQ